MLTCFLCCFVANEGLLDSMNRLFFDVIVVDLYSPYCIHLTVSVQRFRDDSKPQLLQYSEKHDDIAYHATINKTAHLETPPVMTQ